MSSLVIDLVLFGLAYVILIYLMATMTKNSIKKKGSGEDDGDGGIEDFTPPKIDLPPGVQWPSDSPKSRRPEPVEY
ncbi:hypothetical protein SAMN04489724_4029 [Algoriphagus locisalis]|uniref:Uncharacterized protein n=1 Tax=Algoriphagus locisalis TaxID=305507 RepID=A0A1I7DGC4_9BACT|nr:hypothetical protein [Algoriphagus locisalis]SFU10656.1 hypothetical protein SAMN04489724_4029 [Algoriphagus locisalis]